MRVAFATDDSNECVQAVRRYLDDRHAVVVHAEAGPWPEMSRAVAGDVARGDADVGVLMCWSGTGTAIAANKVRGVRAATVHDAWTARGARLWNDANVVALSLKRLAPDVAVECVAAFLETAAPDPDEVDTIASLRDC